MEVISIKWRSRQIVKGHVEKSLFHVLTYRMFIKY